MILLLILYVTLDCISCPDSLFPHKCETCSSCKLPAWVKVEKSGSERNKKQYYNYNFLDLGMKLRDLMWSIETLLNFVSVDGEFKSPATAKPVAGEGMVCA